MKKITIIAILLVALVIIAGCKSATAPTGGEGQGTRDTADIVSDDSQLEESVDTSELDDIDVDKSLF